LRKEGCAKFFSPGEARFYKQKRLYMIHPKFSSDYSASKLPKITFLFFAQNKFGGFRNGEGLFYVKYSIKLEVIGGFTPGELIWRSLLNLPQLFSDAIHGITTSSYFRKFLQRLQIPFAASSNFIIDFECLSTTPNLWPINIYQYQ